MISNKLKSLESLIENGFTAFAFSKDGNFSKSRSELDRNSLAHARMIHILNTPDVIKSISETPTTIVIEANQNALPVAHRSSFFPDGFYKFEVMQ